MNNYMRLDMKYMGSKNRHAKELLSIILKDRKQNQWYVEPFVGGFNLIDKVNGDRIGSDVNKYIIALFQAIQNGWHPPDNLTYEEYASIRINKNSYPDYLVGFVGFGCTYSGKFFGGFARSKDAKGTPRNHCLESKNALLKQAEGVRGIVIKNQSYEELQLPENSIIYCDPPYFNTTKYSSDFCHESFWNWVREKVKEGHTIFASEYIAPDDFVSIWSKEVNNSLGKDTGAKQGVENLFVHYSVL